jgi:hypothetical protein
LRYTPGNIQRLRKLVVHLAVSGRLFDSLNNALSTPEILSTIASKRQALIKSGKAKKQRVLPPIDEAELPTGCPDSARFERLENIATLEQGLTAIQRSKPGDYPLVTTGEHKSSCDHYDFEGRAAVVPMVSSTGHGSATLKRLHYQEGKFAVGNILCAAFRPKPDLVAPSIWVAAPVLPDTSVAHEAQELFARREQGDPNVHGRIAELKLITPHYQHVEGTSFAAPIVASTIACLLEANPELTPLIVRDVPKETAHPVPGADRRASRRRSTEPRPSCCTVTVP